MRRALVPTVCISAVLVAGCGGKHATPPPATTAAVSPAAAHIAQLEAVIRSWSARLNTDDNAGAARLFALPAIVIQAPYAFRLQTRQQVTEWHSTLPCAGHIVSITVHGVSATVVFRLANRPSSKCDGPGQLAAAKFTFSGRKIVRWEQVAVPVTAAPPAA